MTRKTQQFCDTGRGDSRKRKPHWGKTEGWFMKTKRQVCGDRRIKTMMPEHLSGIIERGHFLGKNVSHVWSS